jgi:hypothetical protein
MKLRTWSGSVVETREHPRIVWLQWARGWIFYALAGFRLHRKHLEDYKKSFPRKQLFFVLKFGGKIYLKMTEDQLRAEVVNAGGVGVQFKEKSLVFQCFEIDPNADSVDTDAEENVTKRFYARR